MYTLNRLQCSALVEHKKLATQNQPGTVPDETVKCQYTLQKALCSNTNHHRYDNADEM